MGRRDDGPRERWSRVSFGVRRRGGPAPSPSSPGFLSRFARKTAALALSALVMSGTTLGIVTPVHAASDAVSAVTTTASLVPNAVTNLSVSNASDISVDLSWTLPAQPAGVTVTGIQIIAGSGSWSDPLATLPAEATSYTATKVRSTYSVRVVAKSGYSTAATVRMPPLMRLPRAAYELEGVTSTDTSIMLGWRMREQAPGIEVTGVEIQIRPSTRVLQDGSLLSVASAAWRTVAEIDPDLISGLELELS